MFKDLNLKLRIEQAKKLIARGDYSAFEKLVKQGKVDLQNKDILKLYIESKKRNYLKYFNTDNIQINWSFEDKYQSSFSYRDIQNMLDNGVKISQIFEQKIINSFIKLLKMELDTNSFESITHFVDKVNIMKKIIQFPKYRNMIVNTIDIQTYTELFINEQLEQYLLYCKELNEKQLLAFSTCLSFFKDLGYEPLKTQKEIISLLMKSKLQEIKTKLFYELGFLTTENINKLYECHFDFVKKYICLNKIDCSSIDILNIILNKSETEFYWKDLSEKLNSDAVYEIIRIIKYYYFDRNDFYQNPENVKKFFEENFEKAIPKSSLFNNDFIEHFIKLILAEDISYNNYSSFSNFVVSNQKQLNCRYAGFFIILDKLINPKNIEKKEFFSRELNYNNISDIFLNCIRYEFKDFCEVFNEKGVKPAFYQKIKFNFKYNILFPYIDSNWEDNFSVSEVNYIKLVFDFPNLLVSSVRPRIEQDVSKYFGSDGFTENFYELAYDSIQFFIELPKIDSNYQIHCKKNLSKFISVYSKYPENIPLGEGHFNVLLYKLFNYDIPDDLIIKILKFDPDVRRDILEIVCTKEDLCIFGDFIEKSSQIKSKIIKENVILSLMYNKENISDEIIDNIINFNLDCEKKYNTKYEEFLKLIDRKIDLFPFFTRKELQKNFLQIVQKFDPDVHRDILEIVCTKEDLCIFGDFIEKSSQIKSKIIKENVILSLMYNKENISDEIIDNIINFNLDCEKKYNTKYEEFLKLIDRKIDLFPFFTRKEIQKNFLQVVQKFDNLCDFITIGICNYILENDNLTINIDNFVKLSTLFLKSNSIELQKFKEMIFQNLMQSSNLLEDFKKIENIFLKNHLPVVGKIFSFFKLFHPSYDEYNFSNNRIISPRLKKCPNNLKENMFKKDLWRDIIIFSDLVRASLGSNNRSLNKYLENLKKGNHLFLSLSSGKISYEQLSSEYQNILIEFVQHVKTLYNISLKNEKKKYLMTGNILQDINNLYQLFSIPNNCHSDLIDRIIKMYFHFAGFNSLEEVENYRNSKISAADKRNRLFSQKDVIVEEGDFIKGITYVGYLNTILQNGSVAKEFLGGKVYSDRTPLDTDVSRILHKTDSIEEMIKNTSSWLWGFGPIFFLLKNDERFQITRESNEDNVPNIFDPSKIEIFKTLEDDCYGIRTGFASSEINCILMETYDPRVSLEVVMNGFYIPIADFNGKIVFTSQDYDDLRSKMSGLTYYGENNYHFSKEIDLVEVNSILREQEEKKASLEICKNAIYRAVAQVIEKYDLILTDRLSNDISNGTVEFLYTGSTSRCTYDPKDIDFDFTMRLDKDLLFDNKKLYNLKKDLLNAFHQKDESDVKNGHFRLKQAYVEDIPESLKIDISFVQKRDQITYSTDLALCDYLNTIKKQDEKKYKQIIGNIIIAKRVLREAGCYKSQQSDSFQGGLGGVGIENFILQNGGSFVTAAKNFLKIAEGKDFDEFIKNYYLWNFGENILNESRGNDPHDNYVADNMNELGYNKMKGALQKYLEQLEVNQIEAFEIIEENNTIHR